MTFILVSLVVSSCKKDDNDIEGVWIAKTSTHTNCTDDSANQTIDYSATECTTVSEALGCTEVRFDFKSDGTYESIVKAFVFGTDFGTTVPGTYTLDGDNLEICVGGECQTATFTDGKITYSELDSDSGCNVSTVLEKE